MASKGTTADPYTRKEYDTPAWAGDVSKAERQHVYSQGRRDHGGKPIPRFVIVVWRNPDPNGQPQKVCLPYLPGQTKPGLKPVPPVLYHLLTLRESEGSRRVYITAGEKDADALYNARLLSTTNPFGEGKWTDDYSKELLRFDQIIIIPDRDNAEPAASVARKHPEIILRSLERCRYAGEVRVLELPGLSGGSDDKDLSDWLMKAPDTKERVKELERLADARFDEAASKGSVSEFSTLTEFEFLSKFEGAKVEWLIEDWLPARTIAFTVSAPELFKTWLLCDLAVSVAGGYPFLGQFEVNDPGPVLIVQQEDPGQLLAMRYNTIRAARDPGDYRQPKVPTGHDFAFHAPRALPVYWHVDGQLNFEEPTAVERFCEKVRAIKPKLVLIDPLYTTVTTDDYMAKAARQMLVLKRLRDEVGCSFWIAHHTVKKVGDKIERLEGWGSQFLNAFLETGWQLRKTNTPGMVAVQRHFKIAAKPSQITLSFDIATDAPSRYRVEVLGMLPNGGTPGDSETTRAVRWIAATYAAGGKLNSEDILDAAAKAKINRNTLYRARDLYLTSDGQRIKQEREGNQRWWIIPPEPEPDPFSTWSATWR